MTPKELPKASLEGFVASREKDTENRELIMPNLLCRTEHLRRLRWRYQRRGKEGKTWLLDGFCDPYGYERKYAIKLLQASLEAGERKSPPGPEPRYEPIAEVVERIGSSSEQLCGKRLASVQPRNTRNTRKRGECRLFRVFGVFRGSEPMKQQ